MRTSHVRYQGECVAKLRLRRSANRDALRRAFEDVVAMCIAAGLVGGEGFSVDASHTLS